MSLARTAVIQIPEGLDFSSLKLARNTVTGDLSFDWAPIELICDASGIDVSIFRDQHEDNVAALLTAWYIEHRSRGGAADPVQEQILAEISAEDSLGAWRVQIGPSTAQ